MLKKEWNVGWGFTKLCNLNCTHCYNASGTRGEDELSLDQAKLVVDKLVKNGIKTINYGTGECGLVPEFWELIQYVHTKGIVQGLTTNGSSINKNTIGLVKKYMNDIDVSIDYPEENKHNKFRKHVKAWQWALEAIHLLQKHEIPFSIVTCLHSKNSDEETLEQFLQLSKNYNCDWRINWFRPTGRGKDNESLKLDPIKVHEIFAFIAKKADIKALPDPYFAALLGLSVRKGCPCGTDSFRITPTGKVVPCVYFTKEIDNCSIQDCSFSQVIQSRPFIDITSRDIAFCSSCEYKNTCNGGCASRAFLEHRTLNSPDAYCFKKAGLKENPLKGIEYQYKPEGLKVHDNYLCTAIFKARG